ncbi:MAG: hypothetical protein ACK526_02900 [Planctomyces sp.]
MTSFPISPARILTLMLLTTLVVPQAAYTAESESSSKSVANQNAVRDVVINADSSMQAQIVDITGNPRSGEKVTIYFQNKPVASATSNDKGIVTFTGVRSGPHVIASTNGVLACRFWKSDTAPPSAVQIPAVVDDAEIIRGQLGGFNLPMVVFGGAAIAATVIGVGAQNDADDAQAANAALRARVEALEAASP